MGHFIKTISPQIVLSYIAISSIIQACCAFNLKHAPDGLFKSDALNDSLNVFMQGAVDVPIANYPTIVYIFAFHEEYLPTIEFQSFPGYEMFILRDTTMSFYRMGVYHDKYIKIYSSPSMKRLFKSSSINALTFSNQELQALRAKPFDFKEADDYYRRWKKYIVLSKSSIMLDWESKNLRKNHADTRFE